MSGMPSHLHSAFEHAYDMIRSGELKTLIPFLSLFRLNGKPMNLVTHYQSAPMYNTIQPANSVYMWARQLGKSYAICSDMGIRSALTPFYHTVAVQPRMDQVQRLVNTVYKPVLSSSPIVDQLITKTELQKLSLREFRNGSLSYAEHAFTSVDRLRGISNCATTYWDECLAKGTKVLVRGSSGSPAARAVDKVADGDICLSWGCGGTVDAPAVSDASARGVRDCFRITTAGGRSVTCTYRHWLPTCSGRMTVQDMLTSVMDGTLQDPMHIATAVRVCADDAPTIACGLYEDTVIRDIDILRTGLLDMKKRQLRCIKLIAWTGTRYVADPVVSIAYAGKHEVYDLSVTGTHNYILENGLCSYNCQDIDYDFIDIGNEMMSASLYWGFARYTGTPKTTDTTLALLWDRSSQAEWIIRCTHCGYFNTPNPEHDLMKMIGKEGPVCAKCGKRVYPENGGYVHAVPSLARIFPGYHVSQIIHPLHTLTFQKWQRILYKIETYTEQVLYNEVLGWPYDSAVSPLTLSDIRKSAHDLPAVEKPEDVRPLAHQYRYITVGVDWSGGGMLSDSYTAMTVLGLRKDSDVIDIIYGKRLPKGMTPTQEAEEIIDWIAGTRANAFAYDNGGAGFTRLEIMKHAGLMSIAGIVIVPINYVRPHSGDVMKPFGAQRESDLYYYTLDKSRSMAVSLMSIKSGRLRFPKFDYTDSDSCYLDFLALREDPRISQGNDIVILITKKPGVPDDFSHAVNFGCSQIWDHFGAYPKIGSRYDTTPLDFDENNNPIIPDEVFGPRSDFERFKSAVDLRASVITPDDYML